MRTPKANKKKIIEDLLKEKHAKRNITFSFSNDLIGKFKRECEKHDLKMNQVLEKMITSFLEDDK
jgi:uncharacterized protein (DUF4415 family)